MSTVGTVIPTIVPHLHLHDVAMGTVIPTIVTCLRLRDANHGELDSVPCILNQENTTSVFRAFFVVVIKKFWN